jgi:hypothetical protein
VLGALGSGRPDSAYGLQAFHPDTSHPNTSHSDTPTPSTYLFPHERPQSSTLRDVTNSKPTGGRESRYSA